DSLAVGNDFLLRFCGNKKQKIELAYPEMTTLGTMDFRDTPGMDVPDVLCGKQVIDFAKIGGKENLRLKLNDMILEQDEVIDCQDVEWIGGSLQGRGYDFTVKGSLTMRDGEGISLHNGKITVEGNMDMWDCSCFRTEDCSFIVENLSAHQLGYVCFVNSTVTVSGNFFCAVRSYLSSSGIELGGYLSNSGKMFVGGDLTIQEGTFQQGDQSQTEIGGNVRIIELGELKMNSLYSLQRYTVLRIGGDLLFDSARQSVLQNGRIIVGGNVTQIENEDVDNVVIEDGRFCLELCGTFDQIVDLPGVYERLSLDLTNSKAVHLKQDYSGSRLVGAEKIVLEEEDLCLDYENIELTGDGKVPGDLRCYGNIYVNGNTLEVAGKCIQTGYVQITDGGKLEVSGDYIAEQGRLFITGSVHVKGDVRIKKEASVTMAGERSHFLIEGDYISGSRADIYGDSKTKGILELKGDLVRKDSALSTGINLSDVHLAFSGDHIQKVQIPETAYFGYIKWLDLQNAAGVNFDGITVRAGQITGFSQIQTAGELVLYQSRITLTQNETYAGDIALYDSYLDCNGYEFRISDGGNLEQRDGLVNLDYGTLHVSGDYSMLCNSILQMIRSDDLLQVAGNFSTDSNLSHGSMLRDGRMELWGNFNQGGAPASFGSCDNFVIAFKGNGQRAHFDNTDFSRIANIDPDYRFVSMDDKPLVFAGRMSYHIVKGILSGIQEALGISELNATAVAFLAGMGIGLTAATVLFPEVLVGALGVLGNVVMAVSSLYSMAEAAGGIYSTYYPEAR
ncbi:MAG: hypothetical protein K2J67_08370, partial [Lachnospiraceae bacterium]|nr:hypothetical protein [Lachnospiraceae bacterium]